MYIICYQLQFKSLFLALLSNHTFLVGLEVAPDLYVLVEVSLFHSLQVLEHDDRTPVGEDPSRSSIRLNLPLLALYPRPVCMRPPVIGDAFVWIASTSHGSCFTNNSVLERGQILSCLEVAVQ